MYVTILYKLIVNLVFKHARSHMREINTET